MSTGTAIAIGLIWGTSIGAVGRIARRLSELTAQVGRVATILASRHEADR